MVSRKMSLTSWAKSSASLSYGLASFNKPCLTPHVQSQFGAGSLVESLSINFCAEALDLDPTAVILWVISDTPRNDGSTSRSYHVSSLRGFVETL